MGRLKLAHGPAQPGGVPTLEPETVDSQGAGGHGWIVTVYDNDINTVDEVIAILVVATGCSIDEAVMETWEVHNLGKSVVHHGGKSECEKVGEVISTIGIRVTVSEE